MTSRASSRLLFSGKKCFWKSNISIEVMLVLHSPAQIVEIVAYNHTIQCEAPHLYADQRILLMKLDGSGVASKADNLDRATVDFLFDSLGVSNYSHDSQGFEICMKNMCEMDELLIAKPVDLVAYLSPFVFRNFADNSVGLPKDLMSPRSVSSALNSPRVDVSVCVADIAQLCGDLQRSGLDGNEAAEDACVGVAEAPLPPLKNLPSHKSVSDAVQLVHGAPPRPLYTNPRIVSRRRASAQPFSNEKVKADHHTPSLVPALPLKSEANSAPSSPHHSSESTPRTTRIPLLRALSSSLSTFSLGLLSSTSSPSPSQANSNYHLGDSDGEATDRCVQVDDPKVGEVGDTAVIHSPRIKLLGVKLGLDGLRLPWTATAGNKISPSVSGVALDQLELEVRPFEP